MHHEKTRENERKQEPTVASKGKQEANRCRQENNTTIHESHRLEPVELSRLEYTLILKNGPVRLYAYDTPEIDHKIVMVKFSHTSSCRRQTKPSRKSVCSLPSPLVMVMLTICASTPIPESLEFLRLLTLISSTSCTSQSPTKEIHALAKRTSGV